MAQIIPAPPPLLAFRGPVLTPHRVQEGIMPVESVQGRRGRTVGLVSVAHDVTVLSGRLPR
jgi:hypothetical protein